MKVCLTILATKSYIKFIQPLHESGKGRFLRNHQVSWAILTDSPTVPDGCVLLPTKPRTWHGSMEHRFRDLLSHREFLERHDYVVHMDADSLIIGDVGDEIFGGEMSFTESPLSQAGEPYERQPWHKDMRSKGHVRPEEALGRTYRSGAFWCGPTAKAIQFMEWAQELMDHDIQAGVTNTSFNEEVAINRYVIDHPECKLLDMRYIWPECHGRPFMFPEKKDEHGKRLIPRILTLNKGKLDEEKNS